MIARNIPLIPFSGRGLDAILPAIIEQIPPPDGSPDKPLKLLLFDAYHDDYRGVICLVRLLALSFPVI